MLRAIDQGLSGIDAAFDRLDKAAGRIARDGAGGDLTRDVIELMRARQDIRANLAAIRTADTTIGSLVDVLA